MKKITKAVIPAAGLGTRFLPATKTIPKEMLPIVDKPTLLYNIEEVIKAGIEDVVIISGRNKTSIEDFFDCSYELEDLLEKRGKLELLKKMKDLREKVNIISIRQKEALGLGHAIYTAKPVIGEESFAVLLGDEISLGSEGATLELVKDYAEKQASTVGIMEVESSEVSKYGVISGEKITKQSYLIHKLIEKPKAEDAPSNLVLPGRYIFTSNIFKYLEDIKQDSKGEIQLTPAMDTMANKNKLYGFKCISQRFDAGDKLGYLKANISIALDHPEIGTSFKAYLKDIGSRL